jgi:hypothetical protein
MGEMLAGVELGKVGRARNKPVLQEDQFSLASGEVSGAVDKSPGNAATPARRPIDSATIEARGGLGARQGPLRWRRGLVSRRGGGGHRCHCRNVATVELSRLIGCKQT